jgi:hypothetical protein
VGNNNQREWDRITHVGCRKHLKVLYEGRTSISLHGYFLLTSSRSGEQHLLYSGLIITSRYSGGSCKKTSAVHWFCLAHSKIVNQRCIKSYFYLMGYKAVYSVEKQHTLRRNMSAPSSGSACYLLHAGFLLGLFLDSKDNGGMFLRNVGWLSTDHKT